MKIVAVFHGEKVEEVSSELAVIRSNPTMTVKGMESIQALVPAIAEHGPFAAIYTSLLARALDAASVLALTFGFPELSGLAALGQHANKDGNDVIFYPGYEEEDETTWQGQGMAAVTMLLHRYGSSANILMVGQTAIIGGLVAAAHGISDKAGIHAVVANPNLIANGFVVFEVGLNKIRVVG
ncbi:MAG: histidine phosphatase family protein [Patescibacteria group bacterium]